MTVLVLTIIYATFQASFANASPNALLPNNETTNATQIIPQEEITETLSSSEELSTNSSMTNTLLAQPNNQTVAWPSNDTEAMYQPKSSENTTQSSTSSSLPLPSSQVNASSDLLGGEAAASGSSKISQGPNASAAPTLSGQPTSPQNIVSFSPVGLAPSPAPESFR